jgi:hypothetical protein
MATRKKFSLLPSSLTKHFSGSREEGHFRPKDFPPTVVHAGTYPEEPAWKALLTENPLPKKVKLVELPIQALDLPNASGTDLMSAGAEALTLECVVCMADYEAGDLIQIPQCSCLYCSDCLESKSFQDLSNRLSTNGELLGSFQRGLTESRAECPVRCSHKNVIPFQMMQNLNRFPNHELMTYQERVEEFTATDPVYCRQCGLFLPTSRIDTEGALACSSCGTRTCYNCKQAPHDYFCGNDKLLSKNLKRCPGANCRRLWEKTEGCNHGERDNCSWLS